MALGVLVAPSPIVNLFAVAGAGSIVYELRQKYAPCESCSPREEPGKFKLI